MIEIEDEFRKRRTAAASRVKIELDKPLPESPDVITVHMFDPWEIVPCFYGSYDREFDILAIEVLTDLMDGTHHRIDLAAQMFREMLCRAALCDYGTSPRTCFPTYQFSALLPALIERWKAYDAVVWRDD